MQSLFTHLESQYFLESAKFIHTATVPVIKLELNLETIRKKLVSENRMQTPKEEIE